MDNPDSPPTRTVAAVEQPDATPSSPPIPPPPPVDTAMWLDVAPTPSADDAREELARAAVELAALVDHHRRELADTMAELTRLQRELRAEALAAVQLLRDSEAPPAPTPEIDLTDGRGPRPRRLVPRMGQWGRA